MPVFLLSIGCIIVTLLFVSFLNSALAVGTNTRFVIRHLSRFFNFLKASSKMVLGEKWSDDAGENSINFNTTVDWKMEMQ